MQPNIATILRKDRKKDGKYAIVIKVTYAGQRKQFFTGLFIEDENFKKGKVVKIANAAYYNQVITNKRNEVEANYLKQGIETGEIKLKQVKQVTRKDFYKFGIDYFNGQRNRCKKDYIDRCIYVLEDFHTWAGDVSFQSITVDLLKQYEDHLYKRLARNTINRIFKRIKQVFIAAGVQWIYKPVTYKQPKRDFLTLDEIEKIEKKGRDHIVKWYFLLSCYTGLRYSDLQKPLKIQVNKGVKRLVIHTKKTGEVVSIKISKKVEGFIKKANSPILANNNCNLILRDIISDAEIGRKVNFHMARHSFAVNSLSLKIPIKAVSQLLGHSTIRTTEIYAKYTDTDLDEYMDKWKN